MLLVGATATVAAPTFGGGAQARDRVTAPADGLNAWDGRPLGQAGVTAVGEGDLGAGAAPPAWDQGAAADDFGGASRLANLDADAESGALPLSEFAGTHPKAGVNRLPGVWDFVNRVRYGRLPEPASWALMLIGFGMIGGALRGFVVANRRLARLQPEEGEEV